MKITNSNNLDEKTKKYRELYDQIIVSVKNIPLEKHEEPFRGWLEKNHIFLEDIENLLYLDGKFWQLDESINESIHVFKL